MPKPGPKCSTICAPGAVSKTCELPLQTADESCLLLELTGGPLDSATILLEVEDSTARAGARTAQRMDAQRTLAARAAAEFSGMHHALQSASELLSGCARRGSLTFQETDEVRRSADHAGAIVRELQAYSGQLPLQTAAVHLNELIAEMLPSLQQLLGREIEMTAALAPGVAAILADPVQIRQIILKLAANSAEAMQHRGKFQISTRNAAAHDPALGADSAGAYVVLEIADQGPGLDDASWEHLYEPFFTTRPNGKRGLGLAAVHGIVRQLHGRLWAHSEPGKGAAFRIYLPVAAAAAPEAPDGPATILLMEQNDGLRSVVSSILLRRGYRVLPATAQADALEIARTQGSFDLLISEPDMELVKTLSATRPSMRTLFLNGQTDHDGLPTLVKPFEVEALLNRVRELLPGRNS